MLFIPTSISDEQLCILLLFAAMIVAFVVWERIRPPVINKLREDVRYQQALGVYVSNLQIEEPTPDEFHTALAATTAYLVGEHGIPAADAAPNLRLVVAAFHQAKSYELRNEALAFEETGEYELASVYYQRAARLQAEYDPSDSQFLQTCVARVSAKSRR